MHVEYLYQFIKNHINVAVDDYESEMISLTLTKCIEKVIFIYIQEVQKCIKVY